jgi:hypothetical protein
MSIRLTRRLRRWGTALLAVAYAFGILGPAIAFANADRAAIVHVLDEAHGGTLTLHFHHDSDRHDHSGKTGSKLVHQCCGVNTLSGLGLGPEPTVANVMPRMTRTVFMPAPQWPASRSAGRLDRPPRYLLPV